MIHCISEFSKEFLPSDAVHVTGPAGMNRAHHEHFLTMHKSSFECTLHCYWNQSKLIINGLVKRHDSFKSRIFCMLRNTRSKLMNNTFPLGYTYDYIQAANKLKKYV
jgi:hypothetical protein